MDVDDEDDDAAMMVPDKDDLARVLDSDMVGVFVGCYSVLGSR